MATIRLARYWPAMLIVAVLVVAAGVFGLLAATAMSPAPAGAVAAREYTGPIDARAAAELPNGELVVVGASLTDRARGIVATSDDGGQTWEVVLLESAPLTGIVATGEAVVAIADCASGGDPCLVRGDSTGWHAVASEPLDALAATSDGSLLAVTHVPHMQPDLRLLRPGMSWETVSHGCPPSMVPQAVAAPSDGGLVACGAWNEEDGWIDEGQWQIVDDGIVISEASGQPEGTDLATYDPRLLAAQTNGRSALIANGHAFESSDRGRSWEQMPLADGQLRSTSWISPAGSGWLAVIRAEGTGSGVVRSVPDGWATLYAWPWIWP